MKRKTKRLKLSPKNVISTNEEVFNINSLPVEILLEIFESLNYQDLCRSGRVCKKWREITKCPEFWKKVNVQFSLGNGSMSKAAMKFIGILPTCVTHLRLAFEYSRQWELNLKKLSEKLQANCPNLEVLVFHNAKLSVNICSDFYLDKEYLANIRVLVLHHALLDDMTVMFDYTNCNLTSKIEVLDISRSNEILFSAFFSSNLTHLKRLRLAGTDICSNILFQNESSFVSRLEVLDLEGTNTGSSVFQTIRDNGCYLVELYICYTLVNDNDLVFNNSNNTLLCLKIICLRGCNVTSKGMSSLLKSCPSLQHVYVGDLNSRFSNEKKYLSNVEKCYSKKVHVIHGIAYCDHYAKVDYMCV